MIDLQTSPLANPEPVSWPSKAFRQRVIARIDDALERSVIGPRNSVQMEFLIFKKAKFKEQYLILVSKLLIRIRDTKKKPPPPPTSSAMQPMERPGPYRQ